MDTDIIGMLAIFSQPSLPQTYYPCDGKIYPIASNQVLFSVLGTTFGGNGNTNFAVPNLPAPTGLVYGICMNGIYPVPD